MKGDQLMTQTAANNAKTVKSLLYNSENTTKKNPNDCSQKYAFIYKKTSYQ
jgi:hypothetical protein